MAVFGFGLDLAVVSLCNDLGQGQTDPVAAGLGAAGGIGAVKAVKQKGKLLFGEGIFRGVFHGQQQTFALLLYGQAYAAALG